MIFDTIYYEWDEIKLKHPITANVRIVDQHYEIENKTLNIKLNTSTYDNCEIIFQDELDLMYETIAVEDDYLIKSLHGLKRKLLWHVGSE